jgi:hypothetical protein
MSLDLHFVSQIMYLHKGESSVGNEAKRVRLENKLANWKCDVMKDLKKLMTKEDICAKLYQLQDSLKGYWCKGKKCRCKRTYWVVNASMTNCRECMHHPCPCNGPLV